jgi:hypothetical protein
MNSRIVRVLGLLLAVVGLVVLFLTPDLARTAGHNFLMAQGGSADTGNYLARMQAAADMYRSLGAVLLAVGLFRATQPERP